MAASTGQLQDCGFRLGSLLFWIAADLIVGASHGDRKWTAFGWLDSHRVRFSLQSHTAVPERPEFRPT
jgi:hypothetical protein